MHERSLLTSVLLVAFLALAAGTASAQTREGTIQGTVTSAAGPVTGARVSVNGTQFSAITDADGNYRLVGVPPGKYVLSFSASGFRTVERPVEVTSGGSADVDASLEPGPVQERFSISASVQFGRTGQLSVNRDSASFLQRLNGTTLPQIDVDNTANLALEDISEEYRNAVAEFNVVLVDVGRTQISATVGALIGDQDIIIKTRSGNEASYSGTQFGGLAGLGVVVWNGTNRWEGRGEYYLTNGDVVRAPAQQYTNTSVASAEDSLTVKRTLVSGTYTFGGPVRVTAGAELYFFDFERTGQIEAASTTVPGLSVTIRNRTELGRNDFWGVLDLEWKRDTTVLKLSSRIGSNAWRAGVSVSRRLK